MYANTHSCVRVGDGYSEEFVVKVGIHQGSVLSPLLFIIVLEALSREFRTGVPWEDLYADDLVIITDSLDECVKRFLTWKKAMERKGLRVNAGETKIMICGTGLDLLQDSGSFPCAVCRTGVGSNSIFCNGCKHWVHKKCSGLMRLSVDPVFRCSRCRGTTARPLDGRPQSDIQVGGCRFLLLPRRLAFRSRYKTRGRVYNNCVQSAMLHASKTWALTKPNLHRLQRNDRAMIRQICNINSEDMATVGSTELLGRLGTDDLDLILRERRLRWYGHVVLSSSAVKCTLNIQVPGRRRVGRPMLSWRELTEKKWRSEVRSAMRAASQIPGRGPTSVDNTRNSARK
ncbi:uncharacterized protein LOC130051843 [Ostrea edulis]|uniref:uncharacterized protein LOC130051843 n=1 Tax=Ostrea edulis TaxID=37623 RepID=UPI0024AFE912|nr:uncharacterized protein LOC130051843 [Ostrea edulis]